MNRKTIMLVLLLLFGFYGCQDNNLVRSYILEKSGVLDSPDYISYQQNLEDGKVDDQGYWIINDNDINVNDYGIKVSFVSNNHFDISYYADPELTIELSTNNCYLHPGDSIYISTPQIKNIIESSYKFNEFEIYTYDDNNKVIIDKSQNSSGLIYTIPQDYAYDSISICPIGEFVPCSLSFSAFIKDGSTKLPINVYWRVNGSEVIDNHYSFIPNSDFSIECKFSEDSGKYYLLESNILPSYYDELNTVRFDNVIADSQKLEYSVIIKEYTSIVFNNNKDILSGINAYILNGDDSIKLAKGTNELGKFKSGDEIVISLEKGYTINANGLYISNVIETSNGDTYTVRVTENSPTSASIGIEKKTSEKPLISCFATNGIMTIYHLDGTPISEDENVNLDEKIQVVITPNEGYYITGSKVKDNTYKETMKFSDFKKNSDSILVKHEIKKYITVHLDENDEFGICTYYNGKEKVSGTLDNLKIGDVIRLEYVLTNPDYKIDRLLPLSTSTENIKINEDMDFTTIKRDNYISIKKKG